ncbi:MAG: hypothetical protein ACXQS8_09595, partial [Candidatus Helarchaeales archaeon]
MKKRNKNIKTSILLVVIITIAMLIGILPLITVPVMATTSSDIHIGETYNWTIVLYETSAEDNAANWTDAYNWFAPPKGTYSANISGVLNPDLNFTVSAKDANFINGTIRIGNSSFAGVDQYEIGMNLMLGYYGAQFGLISTIDWEANKALFWSQKAISEGYGNKFNAYWVIDNGSWILFHVEQLPDPIYGFWQNTTLIYNKSNGVLIHADTQNSGYHLIIGNFPGFYLNWTLTRFESASPDNYMNWMNQSWASVANFTANKSGVLNPAVNFTIEQISNGIITGNLSIGNETIYLVDQNEIGSNLMLGYWPIQFGLIAGTDWTKNREDFLNAISSGESSGNEYEHYAVYENSTHIVFYVYQNGSLFGTWQKTILVYHKHSGILVHADTSFGNQTHVSSHIVFDVFPGIFFEWELKEYQTAAADNGASWYGSWSPYPFRGAYSANKSGWFSSSLNLTLTGVAYNYTHGTIKIGNATFTDIDMYEIGSNLMLGYGSAQFGLIAWSNWTANKESWMAQKSKYES